MVKMISIIVVYFVLFPCGLYAASQLPERLSDEIAISTAKKVMVDIETVAFSSITPSVLAVRWGADDSPQMVPPKRVIVSIKVKSGEKVIVLPASSFMDLCDVRLVKLTKSKTGFRIIIKGGDAGGAYSAILMFEGDKIKQRKVVASENPKNAWEETVYYSEFPKDW